MLFKQAAKKKKQQIAMYLLFDFMTDIYVYFFLFASTVIQSKALRLPID